jgi:VWFA-related protein
MRKVFPILTIGVFAFAVPAFLQDYQVNVTTVSVWVRVMNSSGSPVSGLTASDFEIYEDGEKANVTCFEEEQATAAPGSVTPTIPPQKFVLFLDLYNTTPIEYQRVRPQIQDFVQSLYGKNHEVMLAAVMPTKKLGVICPFTRDLTRIRILLGKAIANPMRDVDIDRKYDELFRVFEGTPGDSLADIVTSVAHDAESLADQEKSESEFSLAALESFAGYLTSNDPHEQIVMLLVSGGFSRDPGRRFYEIIDRLALRALNNDPLKLTGFKRSNFDFENELKKTVGKLSKSNVTIYTLDTRGAVRRKEYQDSLIEIADETGGISFYNSLNFKEGFGRVIRDLDHQYVLCYSPAPHQKQGTYHKIKVVCKKSGADLRYRNGYFD